MDPLGYSVGGEWEDGNGVKSEVAVTGCLWDGKIGLTDSAYWLNRRAIMSLS